MNGQGHQTPTNGQPDDAPPKKGADRKPKGLIRYVRGTMEHREAKELSWKPAIYHEELREALIAEADLLGAYGKNFFRIPFALLKSC